MADSKTQTYEGMFLFAQSAASDLVGAADHVKGILTKSGAELISLKKWEERRLAYEIGKQKRGVYLLAYFNCDPLRMKDIERDCNLSEDVLRVMCTRADHLTAEEIQAQDAQQELADEAALRKEEPAGADA